MTKEQVNAVTFLLLLVFTLATLSAVLVIGWPRERTVIVADEWEQIPDGVMEQLPPIADEMNRTGTTYQWVRNKRGEYLYRFVGRFQITSTYNAETNTLTLSKSETKP